MVNPEIVAVIDTAEKLGVRVKIHTEPNKWQITRTIRLIAPYGFMFGGNNPTALRFVCQNDWVTDTEMAKRLQEHLDLIIECNGQHDPKQFGGCDKCEIFTTL